MVECPAWKYIYILSCAHNWITIDTVLHKPLLAWFNSVDFEYFLLPKECTFDQHIPLNCCLLIKNFKRLEVNAI